MTDYEKINNSMLEVDDWKYDDYFTFWSPTLKAWAAMKMHNEMYLELQEDVYMKCSGEVTNHVLVTAKKNAGESNENYR